jgi:hypothetical protein
MFKTFAQHTAVDFSELSKIFLFSLHDFKGILIVNELRQSKD